MDIDTRARAAAIALREAVGAPARRRPVASSRRPQFAIAILLLVSALVAATVIAVRSDDGDHGPANPGGDLPRYLPTWLPDDVEPLGYDQSQMTDETGVRSETLYLGRVPGGAPLVQVLRINSVAVSADGESPGRAVTSTAASTGSGQGEAEVGTTDVRGRQMRSLQIYHGRLLYWLLSFSLTDDELIDLGRTLPESATPIADDAQFAGLVVVGRSGSITSPVAPIRSVRFPPVSQGGMGVQVRIRAATNTDGLAREFFAAASPEPVRGHPAFIPDGNIDDVIVGVEWDETPGLVITVWADAGIEAARQVAESLREVDPAAWAQRTVDPRDPPPTTR